MKIKYTDKPTVLLVLGDLITHLTMVLSTIKIKDVEITETSVVKTYIVSDPKFINSIDDNNPKKVFQETWSVVSGKLVKTHVLEGIYYPETQRIVPEEYVWSSPM